MVHRFIDRVFGAVSESGMERYYSSVYSRRGFASGGPTIDEARRDYRAVVRHDRQVMP